MLVTLIRIVVICIFGLLGLLDLLVLRDALRDLFTKKNLKSLTGWSREILIELIRRYKQQRNSWLENLMPTVLELILIIFFYLSKYLLITDVLIAILIFTDGTELRNHFEHVLPFSVRTVVKYQTTDRKLHYSRLFLFAIIIQTVSSILFMILPYLTILIIG